MKIYLKGCSQGQRSTNHHILRHVKWLLCILLIGSGSDEWQRQCSAAESFGDLISAPCPTLDGECLPVSRRPLCHEASQLVKCRVQQSLTGLLRFIAVIPYCKSDIQGQCHKQWAVAANFCSNIVHIIGTTLAPLSQRFLP